MVLETLIPKIVYTSEISFKIVVRKLHRSYLYTKTIDHNLSICRTIMSLDGLLCESASGLLTTFQFLKQNDF